MIVMRRGPYLLALLMLLALVISACSSPITPAATTTETASTSAVAQASVASPPTTLATPTAAPSVAVTVEAATATVAPSTSVAEASSEASATATANDPYAILGDEFRVDSDGNAIPDFLEVQLGYDPNVDDCAPLQCGASQTGTTFLTDTDVLVLFDSSGSMAATLNGQRKIDVAKRNVGNYMRVLGTIAQVGLVVYGHKGNNTEAGKPESCAGVDVLVPVGQLDSNNVDGILQSFEPTGWTPIAGALEKVEEAFANVQGPNKRVIIVSDGIETCEGDPVAVARRLNESGLNVQVDVIGFDINEADAVQQMQAIAAAGGGFYFDARTQAALDQYFNDQLDVIWKQTEVASCYLQNGAVKSTCDQNATNKAVNYLYDESFKLDATDKPRAEAYRALANEIQRLREERAAVQNEQLERFVKERERLDELRRQLSQSAPQP